MKPKVAFITHYSQMGGAEIFLLRVIPYLASVDAKVFFIGETGPMMEKMKLAGIEVEHVELSDALLNLKASEQWNFKSIRQVFRAFSVGRDILLNSLDEFDADVVYTNSAKSHLIGAAAARKKGIPVVSHMHDALKGGNFGRSNRLLLFWALRLLPDLVVTNSSFTRSSLGKHFWRNEPVIVDCSLPLWGSVPSPRLFQKTPVVFGALNRITRWKGQDKIIGDFHELRKTQKFRDAKLLIVGSPGSIEDEVYKYELWAKAKKLKLTEAIEFRPFTNKIEETLDEIDILLHNPATPEPFGQSVLEAQSRGCVVFTNAPSGATDFIKDGVTGFLSNVESSESPNMLERLLSVSAEDLRLCSRAGILVNGGRFNSVTVAKHLEDIVQLLLPQENPNATAKRPRVAHLDHDNKRGGAEFALSRMLANSPTWKPKAFLQMSDGMGVFENLENTYGRELISSTFWDSRPIKIRGKISFLGMLTTFFNLLLVGRQLRKNLEFTSCEVIHANSTRSLLAALSAKLPGQKVLLHVRDDLSKYVSGYACSRLAKLLVLRKVDAIVSNSQYSLDVLGRIPDRIITKVIPSPIGDFSDRENRPQSLVDQLDKKLVICMVARLTPWKGQILLLEAFAEIAPSFPSAELWLAGSSDFESTDFQSEISKRSVDLGVENQIRMLGHVSDIPALLENVDICVQCSIEPEPMGQNVLQYLAAGKASIVSAEGGPKEWVDHLVSGLQFNPRDKESLRDAMILLLEDSTLREKLAGNAKRVIPRDFDERVNEKFGELVENLSKERYFKKRDNH